MAVIRWQPWHELDTLSRQVDELFNSFAAFDRSPVAPRQPVTTWAPAVELQGNDTEFVLRAELPGIDAKDLDISVSLDAVSISGETRFEQQAAEKGLIRSEFRYGKFQRVIPLPAKVQNDRAQAEFKNGVLTLTLPRLQAVQPQVVKINLAGDAEAAIAPAPTSEAATPAESASAKTAEPETDDVWAA
jgi:HSP20 family protein